MGQAKHNSRGFSLLELMVSLALGLLLVGAAVQIFSKGLDATFFVQQRAQMQQDLRAAQNMLVKDISMAGAGLPKGGLALVSGTGTAARYGCGVGGCYINSGSIDFPTQTSGGSTVSYLYPIIPGYAKGVTINSSKGATDVIAVAYADTTVPFEKYLVTFPGGTPASARFTMPSPAPSPAPPAVTDTAEGLKVGDLLWFCGKVSGNTRCAMGEVTSTSGTSSPYTVNLASTDPMKLNQTGGNSGLSSIVTATGITATRIFLITYYIDIPPDPSGVGNGAPRLMRMVSGQKPVIITENISDLRFTYDIYDDTKTPPTSTDTVDAKMSTGGSPNMIRKVNIKHLTGRSPVAGSKGYQGFDVQTSVSARNLGFTDRYPLKP